MNFLCGKRKGQAIGIDYVIGIAIFVLAISISLIYAMNSRVPQDPFSEQVESMNLESGRNFKEKTNWKVYKSPLFVETDQNLINEPLEFNFTFPSGLDNKSPAVLDSGSLKNSWINHSSGEVSFVANLTSGRNRLSLVYTKNSDLSSINYNDSLNINSDKVGNSMVNVTFSNNGFSSLRFKEKEFLNNSADLSESESPSITDKTVKGEISYSTGKLFDIYEKSTKVKVSRVGSSETWNFYLSNYFTEMYSSETGSIESLESNGTLYEGSSDWVDFYNETGISIIGENLNYTVYKAEDNSRIEVTIETSSQSDEVWFFLHNGDYSEAENQKNAYYNLIEKTIGAENELEGLSRSKLEEFSSKTYSEQKNSLEVSNVEFNLTIPDILNAGKDVPDRRNVVVLSYPMSTLNRFGNHTLNNLKIAVWRGI